uniref:Uncharacterized protein n=1 Tax=Rousettus aegyptiacus TaxID=9407 RepID=A0A7J8JIM3_ROUAE|nr:hypothetical protein HJG63_010393 [Rousettus aegyptiacus]
MGSESALVICKPYRPKSNPAAKRPTVSSERNKCCLHLSTRRVRDLATVEASSPHAAQVSSRPPPEAGHGEAPVQARGRPRFKQKQEFQGHLPTSPPRPVRSCPLPDTVFLLNPEVILKKRQAPVSFSERRLLCARHQK